MTRIDDRDASIMSGDPKTPESIAEAMLTLIGSGSARIAHDNRRLAVTVGSATIMLDDDGAYAFERLAGVVEARLALQRAKAMVAAAGEEGVPLWLVAGSSVLARWLAWSRTDRPLGRVLAFTDRVGTAPVTGYLARRARRELGHLSARIRVNAGQAVAERIELSHRVSAIAIFADKATIRVRRHHLPETIVTALRDSPRRNDRWLAAELIDHPFFAANDLMVADVRNDGDDAVVELETVWQPLRPIPNAAKTAVPREAHPVFPWCATPGEVAELYRLATLGDRMLRAGR